VIPEVRTRPRGDNDPVTTTWATVDGNEAAARVAHALSEVIAIYPITPSSAMGESADAWSAAGRPNLWGGVPEVIEMQSEAGAAGALHGALTKGTLGTTFTASQGLLLMLPNMYKIAGELTPAVIHVAARTLATHALSIFGDHSDVMSARMTGWAMLCASSVQEAQDFALVAHAATLRCRVPFLHFFDGFRTSHEVNTIQLLTDDDLRALVREADVLAHRSRGLTPDAPVVRGVAENPDTYFQAAEAANRFHLAVPGVVAAVFDELAARTGRRYSLVDYHGAPDAERVVVAMGSAAGCLAETVDELVSRGEKVGMLTVRLYRPFPTEAFLAALPASVRSIAVLDRTKEPGAPAEPLHADVLVALAGRGFVTPSTVPEEPAQRASRRVIGGRYGLSSKEFTPPMAKAVFDELDAEDPKPRFTVGIVDDVTHLSLEPDDDFRVPSKHLAAVFYGLGSDGTVGAAKNSVKIIGTQPDADAQGYFVYDSRKSGAVTVSHLRFGDSPIHSTYLIQEADFVAIHQFDLLKTMKTVDIAKPGATLLINSPYGAETWDRLPVEVQAEIIYKDLRTWIIDAEAVAKQAKLGRRINTVMQPCFFYLSGVVPQHQAIAKIKKAVEDTYGHRGRTVVERNFAAIDAAVAALEPLHVPERPTSHEHRLPPMPEEAPDFVRRVTAAMIRGQGDLLPVSAFPVDGTWPTGTSKWEKRAIAVELPIWDPSLCIDCGKCAITCPHTAIRIKLAPEEALADAPESFQHKKYNDRALKDHRLIVQVAPDDCTGCGICVDVCPARSKTEVKHKSLNMLPAREHRDRERANFEYFLGLPEMPRTAIRHDQVKGVAQLQPLFEFSLACSGCGETPYVKTLTQLFGDRMIIANATGCSSIYGGNMPTVPYTTNTEGRGPAWSNSLFEDNAEFGLGMRIAWERQHAEARRYLEQLRGMLGEGVVEALLTADQSTEAGIAAQRERVAQLKTELEELRDTMSTSSGDIDPHTRWSMSPASSLLSLADELVEKSVWIVGGDGWAYDIGYGGLDHVLSTDRNVNVLVLDTEVYSNTGGQMSKSTPRGAVAKFAAGGKRQGKKDLALMAMTYGHVYVARVAMGANDAQCIRAFLEAEAYEGPSLIIAYSHCINHGLDLRYGLEQQKRAVESGHWILSRYNPDLAAQGKNPLILDGKEPTLPLREYVQRETRYQMLFKSDPAVAEALLAEEEREVRARWRYYKYLSEMPVGE